MQAESNRVTIRIPYSVIEIIDRIISTRLEDGENNISRTSIAVELIKLGARIEKEKAR